MRLVTLEEHFGTSRFEEASGGRAEFLRRSGFGDKLNDLGEGRVKAMDEAGIDFQVLSFTGFGLYEMDVTLACEIARDANEKVAEAMDSFPGRFGGFATLPLQDPGAAAKELEYCVKTLGFAGAFANGTVGGQFLDHSRFIPFFEAASSLDVPVYLHPAPPPASVRQAYTGDLQPPFNFLLSTAGWGWHVETGLHALRLMISGLFDRLPNLKMILGHMGENLPYSIVRADSVLVRAGLKTHRPPLEIFRKNFWITTSGYFSIPPVLCAREVLGVERILLSVDYPFSDLEEGPKMIGELKGRFEPHEVEAIANGNAVKLLKL